MNHIEAMKQALEALEYMHTEKCDYMRRNKLGDPLREDAARLAIPAITTIRTAIEQAEKQEPVATVRTWHKNGDQHAELADWEAGLFKLPDGEHTLYTTPPAAPVQDECVVCGDKVRVIPRPWVGLTDEERHEIMKLNYARTEWLVHATEAKLKEKNGGQA